MTDSAAPRTFVFCAIAAESVLTSRALEPRTTRLVGGPHEEPSTRCKAKGADSCRKSNEALVS
jgi:hypothetical protein